MQPNNRKTSIGVFGFTIVELLVVIVVIGILAAITIVAYTGIQNKAIIASLQSDLNNAVRQLKLDQVANTTYPTTLAAANNGKGIPASVDTSYAYSVNNTTIPQTFCITATKNGQSYNIIQDGAIAAGVCPILYLDATNTSSYSGSGTTWTDLSGNGNNGTLNGGVSYSSANGGVMIFDGISGYIDTNTDLSWSTTNPFSMSAWVKSTGESGRLNSIVSKMSYEYTFYEQGNTIGFNYWNSLGADTIKVSNTVTDITQWHFAVVTYDGSVGKLYIDGALASTSALGTGPLSNVAETTKIGEGYKWGTTTGFFKGSIGEIKIFNSALSAADIQQNFNNLRGHYGI